MKKVSEKISRREFIQGSAAAAAGLAVSGNAAAAVGKTKSAVPKQPNILWIMSDEHNPHVCGAYGNTVAQTPSIDALAREGVTFDTHYCNSPLCVPSRSSLTACKYISRVDVWNNNCELPIADIASLPRVLNAAGYESFLCGKQHYDYSRRYGFTEVGGNFNNSYKTGHGNRSSPLKLTQKKLSARFDEFHPGDRSGVMKHDLAVTAGTVEFLKKRKTDDKPFFLFAGYLAPHFPLIVPEANYNKFKGKIEMPTIPPGFLDSLPTNYKVLRAGFQEIDVPDDTVRRGRELYYGLTDWVDDQFAIVLKTLRANPEMAENTVIIYSSDHGENMGEHGMWWKSTMWEQSARVPLVISWPKKWAGGQRRAGASAHVDLVQTIAAIGGAKTPADWNGDSMLPWLDDPKHKWKDYAVSEYYAEGIASGYVMSRQAEWKYVYHTVIDAQHPDERQLFNLKTDPGEFTNLAALPEHKERIAAMHAHMVAEVGGDPNVTEQRARVQLAKGYNRTDPKPNNEAGEAG